ncbi:hypothetical protein RhiXN_07332 [Rhizoctonia solani]|uniref:Peptidase S8/S53 domain-containing protein n=1 Tax=Rhizoctonia solani TaxID=456999 RepID=A0A8H8P635_9AGAM|nr:uncharacterized protein RhiXN_07332 [Rhizoctonia solani]QRW25383.1 hypothetical protein RhiXN_07332 [Rhizoctonia solani]
MAVQSHDEPADRRTWADTHLRRGTEGVAGKFSDATLDKIRAMPEVDYIERDQVVYAIREPVEKYDTQKASPWGLARISHRESLAYRPFPQFEGRAHWGHTAIEDGVDEMVTAMAPTVHAVKVLGSNGSGPMSDVIAGVVWASNQAQAKAIEAIKEFRATGKTSHKGSVANMSLGGSSLLLLILLSTPLSATECTLPLLPVMTRDACSYSPAGAELAVTVGASTIGDERAYFSNYGKCVDIFAPGLNTRALGSIEFHSIFSGTSMASPHVAGLLAYYLSIRGLVSNWNPTAAVTILPNWMSAFIPASFIEKNMPVSVSVESFYNEDGSLDVTQFGGITPAQLKKALIELGERDKLNDLPPETVNILAFNNATNAAGYPWY